MGDRAWQRFLHESSPIWTAFGIAAIVGLLSWFLPNVISRYKSIEREVVTETVYETVQVSDSVRVIQEFNTECTLLDGYVAEIAGVTFCIQADPIPGIIWGEEGSDKYQVTQACLAAGGRIIDLSPTTHDQGCYTYTIFEQLGARHDYRPSN